MLPSRVCVALLWVLTSSKVSRCSQVSKVIQADHVDNGADHSRMILEETAEIIQRGPEMTQKSERCYF